jgi:hypothetical protein
MDLHSSYFWFTTAEFHKEPLSADVRRRCHDLAWQIADMLRSADEVDLLEQTLEVTLVLSLVLPQSGTKQWDGLSTNWVGRQPRGIRRRFARLVKQTFGSWARVVERSGTATHLFSHRSGLLRRLFRRALTVSGGTLYTSAQKNSIEQ